MAFFYGYIMLRTIVAEQPQITDDLKTVIQKFVNTFYVIHELTLECIWNFRKYLDHCVNSKDHCSNLSLQKYTLRCKLLAFFYNIHFYI